MQTLLRLPVLMGGNRQRDPSVQRPCPSFLCVRHLILWLLCLLVTPQALAAFQLSDHMRGQSIAGDMQVIEDPDRVFTLDDLLNREWPASPQPRQQQKTIKGMSASAWWVVLDVENPGASAIDWVLESTHIHTDFLDLYHIDAKGGITAIHTGDKRPISNRAMPAEAFAFPLSTPPQARERIVLRYAYADAGMIDLLARIWDPTTYQNNRLITYYLYGVIFGAVLFVILFNIIIHIPTRLSAFFWYMACMGFTLLSFVANSGLGYRYVWHESAYLTDSALILFTAFAFGFAIQFNRVFLQTKRLMPRADRLLQLLLGLAASGGLCYLAGFRGIAGNIIILTAFSLAIMPFIGLWAWKVLKRTEARWYVIAWSVWCLSLVVTISRLSGIIEVSDPVLWTTRMGFLLEAVLLGLALIDQINVLRKDKIAAEEQLIETLESTNLVLEQKVQARTAELEQARQEAEAMAETDVLTGVGNRRYFFSRGEESLQLAKRQNQAWTLVMLDIDHFKEINDSRGHAAGDMVIKQVARLSQQRIRSTDILGRIGGEEFAFILREAGLEEARRLADTLREQIASTCIDTPTGEVCFSVSFGITSLAPQDGQLNDVLQRADEALYRAKDNGRNRIEVSLAS